MMRKSPLIDDSALMALILVGAILGMFAVLSPFVAGAYWLFADGYSIWHTALYCR